MKPLFFLAFVIVLITLSSCGDDPVQVPKPLVASHMVEGDFTRELKYNSQNQVIQLVMTTKFSNGNKMVSTQDFSYDGTGKLIETTSDTGFKFIYQYEGDRVTKTDEYVNDHLSQIHTFLYDSQNRVTEYVTYQDIPEEGGIIPVAKNTYTYDPQGNVVKHKMFYYSTGGADEILLTIFDYSGYDDKINSEVLFELIAVNPLLVSHKNNPGKLEIRNGNDVLVTTELYTYGYNASNYATVKRTTANSSGQTQFVQTHYFFE